MERAGVNGERAGGSNMHPRGRAGERARVGHAGEGAAAITVRLHYPISPLTTTLHCTSTFGAGPAGGRVSGA